MEIVMNIQHKCRPERLLQKDFVNEQVARLLEKLLPVAGEIVRAITVGLHAVAPPDRVFRP